VIKLEDGWLVLLGGELPALQTESEKSLAPAVVKPRSLTG